MNSKVTETKNRGSQTLSSAGIAGRSVRRANLSDSEETWGTVHEVKGGNDRFYLVSKWDWTALNAETFEQACQLAAEQVPYEVSK